MSTEEIKTSSASKTPEVAAAEKKAKRKAEKKRKKFEKKELKRLKKETTWGTEIPQAAGEAN